jgi:hypothetical protein
MTETQDTTPEVEAEAPTDETLDVNAIVGEAKEKFSLINNIKNREMRTVKIDLGYDEVNSEKLVGIEAALGQLRTLIERAERNGAGVDELKKIVTKLKKELKEANPEEAGPIQDTLDDAERNIKERTNLLEQMKPLMAKLVEMEAGAEVIRELVRKESISVELRAIPYTIARASARRARAYLKITEKGIPEALAEAFEERQLLELAYDQVLRYRDNKSGESGTKLTIEQLETFRDYLPMSQSTKFFTAVNELQFRNAISESAIAQADF